MSTQVQRLPEVKSLDRVVHIPLVHDSLSVIQSTLQTYTPTAYAYGHAVSLSAYNLSAPLQTRLAPLIVSADGYALKGLDVAEKKFPTPFTIKTEDVVDGVRKRRDDAVSAVTRPVYRLANNVDSSLTPIVDRLETAVHSIGSSSNTPEHSPEASSAESVASSNEEKDITQVGRLYHLSVDLRERVYNLSAEQLKHLQSQNVYIQAATERLQNLNANLVKSYGSARDTSLGIMRDAQAQASAYGHGIVTELDKIQAVTTNLPKHLRAKLQPIQEGIQGTLAELSAIVASDLPVSEKASKVGHAVQDKAQPLLAQTTQTIQTYIADAKAYVGRRAVRTAEEVQQQPVHDHEQDVPSFVSPDGEASAQ